MKRSITTLALICALPVLAGEITYVGSETSGDITEAANWSGGVLPGSSDTALFPSAFLSPLAGLWLGDDWVVGTIDWKNVDQTLDLRNQTLTLCADTAIKLAANTALTVKDGALNFTAASSRILPTGNYATLIFTNTHITCCKPLIQPNVALNHVTVKLLKDTVFENSVANSASYGFPFGAEGSVQGGISESTFIVDGGKMYLKSGSNYSRMGFYNANGFTFKIANGGVVDLIDNESGFNINTAYPTMIIRDGGGLYQTNGLSQWYDDRRSLSFSADADGNATRPGLFMVTNATLKVGRVNVLCDYLNADFRDATVDLTCGTKTWAGWYFYKGAKNGRLTISGDTNFKAKQIEFASDGTNSNLVEVAGGTLSSPVNVLGQNGYFKLSGGTVASSTITLNGSNNHYVQTAGTLDAGSTLAIKGSNQTLEIAGGTIAGATTIEGTGHAFTLTGGDWSYVAKAVSLSSADSTWRFAGNFSASGQDVTMNGTGTTMIQDGCAITGGVFMTAANTTCIITNEAYRFMEHRNHALQIPSGTANAQFVICDATVENKAAFHGSYTSTGDILTDAGSVSVNCPGSSIVFKGSHPKLLNTGRTIWAGGNIYVAMVFGSFASGVVGTDLLTDPMALKYVLPPKGYAEAPLQNAQPDAATTDGRPIALCGNAKIIVDASGYQRAVGKKSVIPLIRDTANFTCGGVLLLDVAALNRNNAANLPASSKLKHVVEKDENGKVIAGRIDLVMGRAGFAVMIY